MMKNTTLPNGWTWKPIKEITYQVEKVDPKDKPNQEFIYIDISSIDNRLNKILEPKIYTGINAPSRARQLVRSGDILFSTVRTYLKNIAVVPDIYDNQISSTGFSVLRPKSDILSKFIFYFTISDAFLKPLNELQRGTSYPAVRDGDVRNQLIPVPPLDEQERIVAKIEELFTQLDAGTAALQRVQAGLRRYKASVLKAAVEGRLVPQDANDEPAEEMLKRLGKKPLEGEDLPELPKGWCWVTLEQLSITIKDVDHRMPKSVEDGIPYISPKDFDHNDDIDFNNAKRISMADYNLLSRKIKPQYGDILLSRYGTIGVVRKVNTHIDFQASYSIAIIRPLPINPLGDYLINVLRSDNLQSQMRKNIRASSQPDLGLSSIRDLAIPLPPINEQVKIYQAIEERLTSAVKIENEVNDLISRSTKLKQSILKHAFEGKL